MFGLRNMYKPHPAHNSTIVKSLFLVHFVTSLELLSQPTIFIFNLLVLFVLTYSIQISLSYSSDPKTNSETTNPEYLQFFYQSDRFLATKSKLFL